MDQKSVDQWPRCVDHQDCPYQYILLSKNPESNRLKCSRCLFCSETLKQKEEFKESIPLPIAVTSPQLMINFLKREGDGKYIKNLFEICEKDLDQLFNEQIAKFDLLVQKFNEMKEEIKQRLQEYKEAQTNLRKQKESFLEKCQLNLLFKLIFQLKEFDNEFKSDQYTSILNKINSTFQEILKDNCSLVTQNLFEIIYNHKQMNINLKKYNNDQFQQLITQTFTQYTSFISGLNKNINSYMLAIPEFKILSGHYFRILEQKLKRDLNRLLNLQI